MDLKTIARWIFGRGLQGGGTIAPASPAPPIIEPDVPWPRHAVATADWTPMLGNRLEYRDSGFHIELRTALDQPPYWLFDPEGRPMAFGFDMDGLKLLGEKHARWRAEFEVKGR